MKNFNKLIQSFENDEKHYFYIYTDWGEEGAEVMVWDTFKNRCFQGKIMMDIMEEIANQLEIDFGTYLSECKQALTNTEPMPEFVYKFDHDENIFQVYKKSGFETQYLDVPMKPLRNSYELMDKALRTIKEQGENHQSQNNNTEINLMQSKFHDLEKSIQMEKTSRDDILSKVCILLNSKEQIISKLKNEIRQLKDNNRRQNRYDDGDTD